MNRTVIKKMVQIYDSLIEIASKNIGEPVKMDWGTWVPTVRCLNTMRSRRDKLSTGRAILTYFENRI
tara:strand:- start:2470 stop:2670 length:201 start_codon:yes stop_codon:yes gene_type:complete